MSTERLLEIKSQIADAKTQQSEVKGQITGVEDQMQSKFQTNNLSTAEKKLKKMGEDLDAMETESTEGMEKLEESYPWAKQTDRV